jgi:S-adenosylmethionine:tRNA ribosyltransferase-isomerase
MRLADFNYDVPAELIAQFPAEPRDSSRLMVVKRQTGEISHHVFRDLPQLLDDSYVLVPNNSRVLKSRLFGAQGDTPVGVFLLKEKAKNQWHCLTDVMDDERLVSFEGSPLQARVLKRYPDKSVDLGFSGVVDLLAETERIGGMPLPPYVGDRQGEDGYQTVYARHDGSIAAPTAGLHFTQQVLDALENKGIPREEVTLHVGYGTFASVYSDDLSNHGMHAESFVLEAGTAQRLNAYKQAGKKILSVGTTATRLLESCASDAGALEAGRGETAIFIYPPYRFKFVDALLTNFHMPGLTPVMLVAALAGYDLTMRAYDVAVQERYRFYSFGDSMLVL